MHEHALPVVRWSGLLDQLSETLGWPARPSKYGLAGQTVVISSLLRPELDEGLCDQVITKECWASYSTPVWSFHDFQSCFALHTAVVSCVITALEQQSLT